MTIAGAATGTIWMLKIQAGEQPWPKKKKLKNIYIYIYIKHPHRGNYIREIKDQVVFSICRKPTGQMH